MVSISQTRLRRGSRASSRRSISPSLATSCPGRNPQLDPKSTLITGHIVSQVRRLKAEGEGYLGLGAGPELLALFLENNLIDELLVTTMPMLLGEGVPLFRDVKGHVPLKLTSAKTFEDGAVLHVSSPACRRICCGLACQTTTKATEARRAR